MWRCSNKVHNPSTRFEEGRTFVVAGPEVYAPVTSLIGGQDVQCLFVDGPIGIPLSTLPPLEYCASRILLLRGVMACDDDDARGSSAEELVGGDSAEAVVISSQSYSGLCLSCNQKWCVIAVHSGVIGSS
jgi:hypothetical protein